MSRCAAKRRSTNQSHASNDVRHELPILQAGSSPLFASLSIVEYEHGFYDTSSAGHIPAGDEPVESALRELQEELGITATASDLHYAGMFRIRYEKEFHGSLFRDNEVTRVYVYDKSVDITTLTLQASEVDAVRWFPLEEVWEEIKTDRSRFCVPTGGLKVLRDYLKERQQCTGTSFLT